MAYCRDDCHTRVDDEAAVGDIHLAAAAAGYKRVEDEGLVEERTDAVAFLGGMGWVVDMPVVVVSVNSQRLFVCVVDRLVRWEQSVPVVVGEDIVVVSAVDNNAGLGGSLVVVVVVVVFAAAAAAAAVATVVVLVVAVEGSLVAAVVAVVAEGGMVMDFFLVVVWDQGHQTSGAKAVAVARHARYTEADLDFGIEGGAVDRRRQCSNFERPCLRDYYDMRISFRIRRYSNSKCTKVDNVSSCRVAGLGSAWAEGD